MSAMVRRKGGSGNIERASVKRSSSRGAKGTSRAPLKETTPHLSTDTEGKGGKMAGKIVTILTSIHNVQHGGDNQ